MVDHEFGGRHTDDKLNRLQQYLVGFSIALKNQGFVRVYIDAFAGSGDRAEMRPVLPLFDGEDAEPEIITVPGSARIALEVKPTFDRIVLIEKDPRRYEALTQLAAEYPDRNIQCHPADANSVVKELCRTLPWRGSVEAPRGMRAVMFLDPYGMEVDWSTVQAIAATRAIDLWYFFPLMGLYRQAANDVIKIDHIKRDRLNRILGTNDWESDWYDTPHGPTNLFDDPETAVRTADVNAIERYVKTRLKSEFKGAVLDPLRIINKQGAPLASLFFAVSNPSSAAVARATAIAGHILKKGKISGA